MVGKKPIGKSNVKTHKKKCLNKGKNNQRDMIKKNKLMGCQSSFSHGRQKGMSSRFVTANPKGR